MAQWTRRLTTNQEIPGSTPGSFNFCLRRELLLYFFFLLLLLLDKYAHDMHDLFMDRRAVFFLRKSKHINYFNFMVTTGI
jgi:hypothetical protein